MLRIATKHGSDFTELDKATEPGHDATFKHQLKAAADKTAKKKDAKDIKPPAPDAKAKLEQPEQPTVSRTATAEPTRRIPKVTDVDELMFQPKGTGPIAAEPATPAAPTGAQAQAKAKPPASAEIPDETVIVDPTSHGTIPPPLLEAAMSPIEQAIHSMLAAMTTGRLPRITDHEQPKPGSQPIAIAADAPRAIDTHTATPNAVKAPAPIAEPRAIPEALANPSHVHLVVGDDAQRVVLTVAVRGNQVSTTMRTSDDSTSAALTRNAAVLDDAMRARGLELAELDTGHRDAPPQQHHHQQHHQHEQDRDDDE